MYDKILEEIISLSSNKEKENLSRFFKTNEGDYAEKDIFLGIKVPVLRNLSKKYYTDLSFKELKRFIESEYHEVREFGIYTLVLKSKENPKEAFDLYLDNIKHINNWDLVDASAPHIIGKYLYDNKLSREILYDLSNKGLWEQRIAIISTQYFIKNNDFKDTLTLSKKYLNTNHDLIKKATGWMLREIGDKDPKVLYKFLNDNIKEIQGITFSYATEKISKEIKEELKKKRI